MAQISGAMVQQAQANAKAVERQEREAQEAERKYYQDKYKNI